MSKKNEVGKVRKMDIFNDQWTHVSDDVEIKGAQGILVVNASPYEVNGVLGKPADNFPVNASTIKIGAGISIDLEIGENVELYLRGVSPSSQSVYVQEYK